MWVDEAIWGHRLHDEQTPWLAFLEFLNVLRSEDADSRAFQEVGGMNTLQYRPCRYLYLRNILFNNPRLPAFLHDLPDDDTRWTEWAEHMSKNADGLRGQPSFYFVRDRFVNFEEFALVVHLLRTTAIEGESNKRWSSKFVFPYGPAALYEDLNVKPQSVTNDRRFFGRVGEIVYLMLCRSGKASELLSALRPLVLNETCRWNRLVRAFTPNETEDTAVRANAYLPYASLSSFGRFADDWIALLQCHMPGYDVIPHLVDLLGLHIVLYTLQCAQMWVSPDVLPQLVLEIIAPRRTTIRDLATETYLANNLRSREAIDAYLHEVVDESSEWQSAMHHPDAFGEAFRVLRSKVAWPDADMDEYNGQETPTGLRGMLQSAAHRRHDSHVANVHARYAHEIGLASRRGTRRVRYAPNDQILRSLVFANVERRMEFQQFLFVLYEKYGFVIGHRQASTFIGQGQSDQKSFEDNARRLEQRLASLGLLRRLSDACAYIENPYARDR
jgi:hypothetical protein